MVRNLLFIVILLSASNALAFWNFRPQAGFGISSNAYFSKDDPTSDLYAWTRASGSYLGEKNAYSFALTYRGYSKTPGNNVLIYRAGVLIPAALFDQPNWEVDLNLGGQDYIHESPGTTEQSFDFLYARAALLKTIKLSSEKELVLQPGYEARSYSSFNGRFDHDLSGRAFLSWAISQTQELEPFFGLGVLISNQNLYTRRYIDLGVNWSYLLQTDLKLNCEFSTSLSTYPNRTITATTAVTRNRGRVFTMSQEENETQSLTQLSTSIAKILKSGDFKGTAAILSSSSRSGAVDYSELNINGSYTHYF